MKNFRLVLDTIVLTYVAIKAAEGLKMMAEDLTKCNFHTHE